MCLGFETFMNESGYTLYKSGSTPYRDLFASINLQADEVIFGRDYEASLSVLHNVQNYENSTTMGRPGMNKKIVNSYLMADGSRFTDKAGYETMHIRIKNVRIGIHDWHKPFVPLDIRESEVQRKKPRTWLIP